MSSLQPHLIYIYAIAIAITIYHHTHTSAAQIYPKRITSAMYYNNVAISEFEILSASILHARLDMCDKVREPRVVPLPDVAMPVKEKRRSQLAPDGRSAYTRQAMNDIQ